MKMNYPNMLMLNSPWPMITSMNMMNLSLNLSMNINKTLEFTMVFVMILMMCLIKWNNNMNHEYMLLGMKNNFLIMSYKNLMILIILTEMMFFSTFFYLNFSMLLFNNIMFNFKFFMKMFKLNFFLSFLNLMILVSSSMTLMLTIYLKKKIKLVKMLNITIILGMYFLLIQWMEYIMMNFNLSNSIFFSNFFMLTLFHMSHVMIGILMMLTVKMDKKKMLMFNKYKLKMLCWYWHFVDLIWIMIFLVMYI